MNDSKDLLDLRERLLDPTRCKTLWDPENLSKAFYGAESMLADAIRDAASIGYEKLSEACSSLTDNRPADHLWTRTLRGFMSALSACSFRKFGGDEFQSFVAEAIESFELAWELPESEKMESLSTPLLTDLPIGAKFHPLAMWAVSDLIAELTRSETDELPEPRSVRTPILGGIVDQGLFYLTIELFPCEGGLLVPDLRYLGLTKIVAKGKHSGDGGATFLQAMNEVWEMSGAGKSYRGRWRLEPPAQEDRRLLEDEAENQFPSSIAGRSAQAATLCAILAATGNPYHETGESDSSFDNVDPLDDEIAISAKVIPDPAAKDPTQLQLGAVENIPEKLSSARSALDTVVFCKGEKEDKQIQELNDAREEAQKNATPYDGLHIEKAETVADALDMLLVTNRHLRKYQGLVRESWLKQWQRPDPENGYPGARFPGDDAPGPDMENLPEQDQEGEG
ncbi:MAG: hypothetical protein AAF483_16845 [Planctomycetota bacterium]